MEIKDTLRNGIRELITKNGLSTVKEVGELLKNIADLPILDFEVIENEYKFELKITPVSAAVSKTKPISVLVSKTEVGFYSGPADVKALNNKIADACYGVVPVNERWIEVKIYKLEN
ncbi:MAG: hypothetical protein H7321_09240 [Bacteroidia bacterium]|nr:hypothetical protein [Bacteroidia bacterium]